MITLKEFVQHALSDVMHVFLQLIAIDATMDIISIMVVAQLVSVIAYPALEPHNALNVSNNTHLFPVYRFVFIVNVGLVNSSI